MTKPFELAPDAHTRAVDCGQFSRTASGAPFCACLKQPYCCAVGESEYACSFRTPKEQGPYKPTQEPKRTGRPAGREARHIEGFYTLKEAARAAGLSLTTIKYRAGTILPSIEGHAKKIAGIVYIDEFAYRKITQSAKAHGKKAKR